MAKARKAAWDAARDARYAARDAWLAARDAANAATGSRDATRGAQADELRRLCRMVAKGRAAEYGERKDGTAK